MIIPSQNTSHENFKFTLDIKLPFYPSKPSNSYFSHFAKVRDVTLNNRYTDQLINKNNRNYGLKHDITRTLSSGYLDIKYYLT